MRVTAHPALPLVLSLLLVCAWAAPPVPPPPAAEPDIQAMIEALMPSATRRMRNLVVRQKAQDIAATEAPAASAAAVGAGALDAAAAAVPPAAAPAVTSAVAPAGAQTGAQAAAGAAPLAAVPADAAALLAAPAGPPPSLALAIQFEPNSSRVRPQSGPMLGSLVAAMQSPELKASRFLIEGHADPRGAAAQNQRLSQERAEEVRQYLVSLGVHPSRLRAVGRGASQPANAGDPTAAANRRVRVVTVE